MQLTAVFFIGGFELRVRFAGSVEKAGRFTAAQNTCSGEEILLFS